MATTVATLELYAGEDVTINGTAQDSEATAINLTSYTTTQLTWRLARSGASAALVEYTIGDGITITTAASGTFAIAVDGTDTASLSSGPHVQYMIATDNDGVTDVIWSGAVAVAALPGSPA